MLTRLRFLLTCFTVFALSSPFSLAYDSPMTDTAVRDAYFLGQHRDQTMAEFLSKYTKQLPIPATGRYINSISFLTPFALMVHTPANSLITARNKHSSTMKPRRSSSGSGWTSY